MLSLQERRKQDGTEQARPLSLGACGDQTKVDAGLLQDYESLREPEKRRRAETSLGSLLLLVVVIMRFFGSDKTMLSVLLHTFLFQVLQELEDNL